MSETPLISPSEHPMVLSATARLASCGGWARILAGKPLEDVLDLIDAELLIAAQVLRRNPDETLEPVDSHPWHFDPESLAGGTLSYLRQALRHAEGGTEGWPGEDLDIVLGQGRTSVSAATSVADGLLPQMPAAHQAFLEGRARFLDVGVGIGALAGRLCELFPGVTGVGLDVLPPVLEVARARLAQAGLTDRVELRTQSVADLCDREEYDLVWLPQAFIPRHALLPGLPAVFRALRPDRWLVAPVTATPVAADEFQRAVHVHGARLSGGGPISVTEISGLLEDAGFEQVAALDQAGQTVMLAHRPEG
jgi:SAM-dependent methyltransferase